MWQHSNNEKASVGLNMANNIFIPVMKICTMCFSSEDSDILPNTQFVNSQCYFVLYNLLLLLLWLLFLTFPSIIVRGRQINVPELLGIKFGFLVRG